MTLQEALKSDKKIKRSIHTLFSTPSAYYSPEEILATDWETEVEQVLITKEQALVINNTPPQNLNEVLRELGFKDNV